MKPRDEMHEGPEAYARFANTMRTILSVPKAEIDKRVAVERAKSALNPNRPGPKTKKRKPAKASASRDTV